ncbi:DeoR/GlpR family DNA-binding transcription regulator [Brooklawnia cerclae]|uniref:DeoR/GlpR family transcriptional regulator of sugar metabolism n=1 Tax=Brooklawnia cerclae TaxID=349934 RepID=A0ABX0SH25_9ACTN|nr:DeoR/GlpR family DNA-binding transcription regulator [Brooklawnia cerclae]NIH56002.1 DeoR/GlpR family transcriptional regulator of sugar metabolism [Brooklawnia cerclae]
MRAAQRREEILHLAKSGGPTSVDDLAVFFDVTASTIRRDLARLSAEGQLARTYGGAMAVHPREQPLDERAQESHAAKVAIGKWAATAVQEEDSVLLDAGTTTAELARALRSHRRLTVATTGLTPLAAISGVEGIEVICLGGQLREMSQGFVGPLTEAALETMTFDVVFLGADGVTPERGICEASLVQTRLKELMWRSSTRTYVLADSGKLGQEPFHAWVRMPRRWTLVTDDGASDAQVGAFARRGVEVVVVGPAGDQVN